MSDKILKGAERKACWAARDTLFECLEKNNEELDSCSDQLAKVEELCPKKWVKYFLGKRKKDLVWNEKMANPEYYDEE